MWTFTIKGQDLETNLVIDTSDPENKYLEYNGYFGYRFKIVDTVQVFYNFNFVVKIEKSTKKVISTDYSSLTQNSKLTCDETNASNCITKADSSLKFCKSPDNCSDLSDTIGLFLN